MADQPQPATPPTASTGGWDVVHAVPFSVLNAQIAAGKSWPSAFSWSEGSGTGAMSIAGTFGSWQLDSGSGTDLTIAAQIVDGTLTVSGKPVAIDGSLAKIDVDLDWLPTTPPSDATAAGSAATAASSASDAASRPMALAIRSWAATAPQGSSCLPFRTTPKPPSVSSVTGHGIGSMEQAEIQVLLEGWLAEHPEAFTHIFASADLAITLAEAPGLQWLMPTCVAYAAATPIVADKAPAPDPVFGVLSMTEGRTAGGAQALVAPSAIPAGATSALLISSDRVQDKLLRPAVASLFRDAKAEEFSIDGDTISNLKTLVMQPWALEDGTVVQPTVAAGDFSVTLHPAAVDMDFADIRFEYGNADTQCHVVYHNTSTIYLAEDGHLDLRPLRSTSSGEAVVSDRTQLSAIMLSIGITIFTMAVGAVIGAGMSAAEGETAETANGVEVGETTVEFAEDASSMAGTDAVNEADGLDATKAEALWVSTGGSSLATKIAGVMPRFLKRFAVGFGVAMLGVPADLIAQAPEFMKLYDQGQIQQVPGLDRLAAIGVSPVAWNGIGDRSAVSAELMDSLVIGLVPKPVGTPPAQGAPGTTGGATE